MALYFDNKIQAAAQGPNNLVEWHKSLPILAVGSYNASTGGTVHLYTDEVCVNHFFVIFIVISHQVIFS